MDWQVGKAVENLSMSSEDADLYRSVMNEDRYN